MKGEGGTDVFGDKTSSENCPSRTDCFRACGWLDANERASVRATGEGVFGVVEANHGLKAQSLEQGLSLTMS